MKDETETLSDYKETIGRGTYSPDDNKLRIYPADRLDEETSHRLKSEGFRWAPGQKLWVAPAWTPNREDLVIELCGSVEDEDKSLVERAEERAEAFQTFAEHRNADAAEASGKADRIASMRPMGQPILVGHHSERRARRDLDRVHANTRKAIKFWDQAKYWERRALAAVNHAAYKADPQVRARRIKELEKQERLHAQCSNQLEQNLSAFHTVKDIEKLKKYCLYYIRTVGHLPLKAEDKTPLLHGPELSDLLDPESVAQKKGWFVSRDFENEVVPFVIRILQGQLTRSNRWLDHFRGRLEYERAMLAASGGIPADSAPLEVGGAIKHQWSPDGGFDKIRKVNKTSVNVVSCIAGQPWPHKICKTKIQAVLTKAQVDELRAAGGIDETEHNFVLVPVKA